MSSFTAKTVCELHEAYKSIYVDDAELLLNTILDEVHTNINYLVNEGYDFSEYSWDELYELFLENFIDPELSFTIPLNEFSEKLTEEQVKNLLKENIGQFIKNIPNAVSKLKNASGPIKNFLSNLAKKTNVDSKIITGPPIRRARIPSPQEVRNADELAGIYNDFGMNLPRLPTSKYASNINPRPQQSPYNPSPLSPAQRKEIAAAKQAAEREAKKTADAAAKATADAAAKATADAAVTNANPLSRQSGTPPRQSSRPERLSGRPERLSGRPETPGQPSSGLDLRPIAKTVTNFGRRVLSAPADITKKIIGTSKGVENFTKKLVVPAVKIGGVMVGGAEALNQGVSIVRGRGIAPSLTAAGAAAALRGSSMAADALADRSNNSFKSAFKSISNTASDSADALDNFNVSRSPENQPNNKNKNKNTSYPPPPRSLTQPQPQPQPQPQNQSFEFDNLNVINEGPNFPTTKPKSNYDQLTIGGITKLWDPASNSYQLPGTINKRLKSEGEDLIKVPGKAKPDPVTPLTTAQRATQQRLEAGVVKGGESGFKSLVPKPTPQKGESAEKFKARQSRYEDSQRLAQTLTQSQQKAAADAAAKAKATADAAAKAKATADAAAKAKAEAEKAKVETEKPKTGTATTGTATTGTATTGTATTGTATTGTTTQKPPVVPPTFVAQTGNRDTDLTTWANANKGMINKVGTQQQKDILSAVESGKPLPKAPESIKDQVNNMQKIRMQRESTAYDIVLDYLISTNQVDTIEEAHYVMMQLDSDYIGNIVEEWRPVSKGAIKKLGGVGNINTGDMLNRARYTTSKGGNKPTSTTLRKRQEAQAKEAGMPPHRGQKGGMSREYSAASADAMLGNSSGPAASAMKAGDQKDTPYTSYYFKFMNRPKR